MNESHPRSARPMLSRASLGILLAGVMMAGVVGVVVAGQASASKPVVSKSVRCDMATDDVIVTLTASQSWWSYTVTSNRGLPISTNTASTTITFTIPRAQVPTTLSVRYKGDPVAEHTTTIVVNEPSCMAPPPPPPVVTTTTTTTVAPPPGPGPVVTSPPAPGPTTEAPPTTDEPTRVEGKTTVKTPTKRAAGPSGGAPKVAVGTINYAG